MEDECFLRLMHVIIVTKRLSNYKIAQLILIMETHTVNTKVLIHLILFMRSF